MSDLVWKVKGQPLTLILNISSENTDFGIKKNQLFKNFPI